MAEKLKLGVITASTREGRRADVVARWFLEVASARADLDVVPLDLREFPLPFYAETVPAKLAEARYPADDARGRWVAAVAPLDAYAVVTPEYNHAYPAVLKNALDHGYAVWNRKPIGFVSYGGVAGGARAVEQLRLVVIELQMAPVRSEVNLALVHRAFDEAGRPKDASHVARAETLLDDLVWWGEALRDARRTRPPRT
jgi:NAD(P)H-dependent FMN reductase